MPDEQKVVSIVGDKHNEVEVLVDALNVQVEADAEVDAFIEGASSSKPLVMKKPCGSGKKFKKMLWKG